MLLVGISTNDTEDDVTKLANKVCTLRLFEDEQNNQLWKKNIKEVDGSILSVSQFTLYAKTKKGTKPDFHKAQKGHIAKDLCSFFLKLLKESLGEDKVQDGVFGAMMSCSLTNEGPTTILLDSEE
ncbi:probable D-tyrosyl-tRNA(Tyr) deacylase [Saccharomycodes ludwigii]|uniref:D-aminoacyl-tRNA deacylase n=1 Tax=Saccharomycodes ludwigii TaxID=36035 RepID=A0A376BAX3_9ASCO|nr:probable D-tyrosyl-tRNA(Tyr) deacylase [Saccharomycodes ludwigii]